MPTNFLIKKGKIEKEKANALADRIISLITQSNTEWFSDCECDPWFPG